jgi:calcium-dependent protein kinase
MQRLKHPNIIKLKEVYEGDHTFYLILELLKGDSLTRMMKYQSLQGLFPMDKVREIVKVVHSKIG